MLAVNETSRSDSRLTPSSRETAPVTQKYSGG